MNDIMQSRGMMINKVEQPDGRKFILVDVFDRGKGTQISLLYTAHEARQLGEHLLNESNSLLSGLIMPGHGNA